MAARTRQQKRFSAAAKSCKVEFRKKGSPKQRRRNFNDCIKRKLRK